MRKMKKEGGKLTPFVFIRSKSRDLNERKRGARRRLGRFREKRKSRGSLEEEELIGNQIIFKRRIKAM